MGDMNSVVPSASLEPSLSEHIKAKRLHGTQPESDFNTDSSTWKERVTTMHSDNTKNVLMRSEGKILEKQFSTTISSTSPPEKETTPKGPRIGPYGKLSLEQQLRTYVVTWSISETPEAVAAMLSHYHRLLTHRDDNGDTTLFRLVLQQMIEEQHEQKGSPE